MDAGPVWASATFPMRRAKKSVIYRNEVTEAAVARGAGGGRPLHGGQFHAAPRAAASAQPPLRQAERAIDWQAEPTATILRQARTPPTAFPASPTNSSASPASSSTPGRKRRCAGAPGERARPPRDGAAARHGRRRGVDRPRPAPGRHQAAGDAGLSRELPRCPRRRSPAGGHRRWRPGRTSPTRKPAASASCISSSTTAP